ncbi:MAG TPA: tetratricopeptide repeat protein, partial [Candidatus Hydrogenedentes bacterium]|nr:tetratricopeptide repeat protein [Candidatus Hydrogenedentota bacterium]
MQASGELKTAKYLRAGTAVFVFLLVLSLFPFAADPANDIKILLYHWAAFLLAAWLLVSAWLERRPVQRPRLFLGVLAIFLALNLAAGLGSSYVGHSMVEVRKFFSLFLLYIVAANAYRTPAQVGRLMLTLCAAVALSTGYAFFQNAGLDPFPWADTSLPEYAELPATFGNANFAAHALILCIIMAIYLGSRARRIWCLAFLPLFFLHLYLTNQRGGVVAIAAALALVLAATLLHRRLKRPGPAIVAAMTLVIVFGALAVGALAAVQFARTGVAFPLKRPLLLRYHAYGGAVKMIAERPVLGYGPGNYVIENAPFWSGFEQENFAVKRAMNDHVHNDLLEIAVDAGIPAAGLYLTFLVTATAAGLYLYLTERDAARRRLGAAFAALFWAFLVDGLFGFNLRVPVSGAILFILAGALEGVWLAPAESRRRPPPLSALVWRGAVIVLAWVCLVFDTRVFASQVLLQRGNGAVHWGDYGAAAHVYANGERLAPWNWLFAYKRGIAASRQGHTDEAIAHFERALERHPNYVMTLVRLGQTHLDRSQSPSTSDPATALERADDYAKQALALCAMLPEAEDVLGRVAFARAAAAQNQASEGVAIALWREADRHLGRAILLEAENPGELYTLLASARWAQDDLAGAEQALIQAVKAEPGSVDA